MRELLGIAPGTTMDNILLARLRGCQDTISLKRLLIKLERDIGNDWIFTLEKRGVISEEQLDELRIINSYLNFMQNRTGPISDGYGCSVQ